MYQDVLSSVDHSLNDSLAALTELVAIPSISADSFDQSTLDQSAAWIADKARALGLDARVIQVEAASGKKGRPAVLATRAPEPGKPTVVLYAHHDVQPVGDLSLWETEPFIATERDGRLFGRGTADDKAGVVAHLAAIAAARPGVGITLFIEGEEEVGSPTFVDFLHEYKDELNADVIVVADSNNWKVGTPSLTTSLRGVTQVAVTVTALDHAVHSGMYGGPVLDSVTLAARLIATLHDDEGNVAVEGLLAADDTAVDYPEEEFRADVGVLEGVRLAGSGSITSRLWTKPAVSVTAMDATPVKLTSNTISPSTTFVLSMRVSPGQDSGEAADKLVAHLESHAPFGARVECVVNERGPAFSASEATETSRLMEWALAEAWGTKPVNIGVGGSIPFIADLAREFPSAQILVTGIEDPDTRAHSANESLHIGDWRNAIAAEALLLTRLGE
ncbi:MULTISPECIES: dipeptidase [Trueperella]|uniref:Acetylornithine deacetylase/succinyl-diaminopimelate desuccinylase-like protein n=1 Tax=Trueperella abortisuis TaxID=445930 RepID=A0ABT9PJE8_9ACTO|nr:MULTISPECIES: dipeptidase [Trueperella]MCI7304684.1 dipeptidase [Trueperella sp.]MDP9832275.1 acetylornithine deacetylase/succinyl-diaminopimelate desuccinylase-like protein [Trueperella abortisuis]MDY5403743.1 dipeptidase [Trueperella sp.]